MSMTDENNSYLANASPQVMSQDLKATAVAAAEAEQEPEFESASSGDITVDDQSDGGSASSEDESDDVASSELSPYFFTTPDIRRTFVVKQVIRAQASHRPAFTFSGYSVEHHGSGSETERGAASGASSHRQSRGSQTARGGQTSRARLVVVASDLTLDIAYEPPSPKFSSQRPGISSYRVKLSSGTEFLYSTRGLPEQITVDQNKSLIIWGPLELQYSSKQQMQRFTENVKHVKVSVRQPVNELLNSVRRPVAPKLQPKVVLPAATSAVPEKPSDQQSSFGSPLPSPLPSPGKSILDSSTTPVPAPNMQEATTSTAQSTTSEFNFPGPAEAVAAFVNDNWAWLGFGVAAVSLVTFLALKSDSSVVRPSSGRFQNYELHLI